MTKPGRLWVPSRRSVSAMSRSVGRLLNPRRAARLPDVEFISPDQVADLYAWWDGYDSATYGSTGFTGITDKGPNALHGVPDVGDIVPPTAYDFDGSPVNLPGPFVVASPTRFPGVADTKTWTDFTVVLYIPISKSQSTLSSAMALYGASPFYLFNVSQSAIPGALDVSVFDGGTANIQVGFGAVLDGHAVLVARNTVGGSLVVDVWYDDNGGSGMQRPATVTVAGSASALAITHFYLGGRGSITQSWGSNPIHSMALFERAISNDEAVGMVKFAGARTGWDLASIAY